MRLIRLLAAVVAGAAALVRTLVLPGRRPRRLRRDRARATLRLAVRGGGRYAAGAPRLFAVAGEQRELLREDLALQTAGDVAGTLGAMTGVLMKIGQMASRIVAADRRQLAGRPGPITGVVCRSGLRPARGRTSAAGRPGAHGRADRGFHRAADRQRSRCGGMPSARGRCDARRTTWLGPAEPTPSPMRVSS